MNSVALITEIIVLFFIISITVYATVLVKKLLRLNLLKMSDLGINEINFFEESIGLLMYALCASYILAGLNRIINLAFDFSRNISFYSDNLITTSIWSIILWIFIGVIWSLSNPTDIANKLEK